MLFADAIEVGPQRTTSILTIRAPLEFFCVAIVKICTNAIRFLD